MKKINKIVCIFSMGLVVTCVGIPFASAQTVYPQRVLIQRQSLLGQTYASFLYWLGFRTPDPVPVNNDPYSAGVTSAPTRGGAYTGPIARPGVAGPVANGITPTRGPAGSGGSCASCNAGYDLNKDGNCVASGGGNSGETCCEPNSLITISSCDPGEENVCRCLSSSSKIATPIGDVAVTSLKVGDIVWTTDAVGKRVVRPLLKASHISAPNHHVVHLVLADGRTLDVSAPHPTADGRTVGDLKVGDAYDDSTVRSAVLKAYEGSATYDILPAGDTGYYWANGILMGSTLK